MSIKISVYRPDAYLNSFDFQLDVWRSVDDKRVAISIRLNHCDWYFLIDLLLNRSLKHMVSVVSQTVGNRQYLHDGLLDKVFHAFEVTAFDLQNLYVIHRDLALWPLNLFERLYLLFKLAYTLLQVTLDVLLVLYLRFFASCDTCQFTFKFAHFSL